MQFYSCFALSNASFSATLFHLKTEVLTCIFKLVSPPQELLKPNLSSTNCWTDILNLYHDYVIYLFKFLAKDHIKEQLTCTQTHKNSMFLFKPMKNIVSLFGWIIKKRYEDCEDLENEKNYLMLHVCDYMP